MYFSTRVWAYDVSPMELFYNCIICCLEWYSTITGRDKISSFTVYLILKLLHVTQAARWVLNNTPPPKWYTTLNLPVYHKGRDHGPLTINRQGRPSCNWKWRENHKDKWKQNKKEHSDMQWDLPLLVIHRSVLYMILDPLQVLSDNNSCTSAWGRGTNKITALRADNTVSEHWKSMDGACMWFLPPRPESR